MVASPVTRAVVARDCPDAVGRAEALGVPAQDRIRQLGCAALRKIEPDREVGGAVVVRIGAQDGQRRTDTQPKLARGAAEQRGSDDGKGPIARKRHVRIHLSAHRLRRRQHRIGP